MQAFISPPPRSAGRFLVPCCVVFLVLLGGIRDSSAFALNGYSWPGSQINMQLQLNHPDVPLQDGFSSWNASAADALSIWNQHLAGVSFVGTSGGPPFGGDGANSVSFSNTIYGDPFPAGVLAVTLAYSPSGTSFTETDVIFNNSIMWDSYRGPIQGYGPSGTYDFHRVALHEFGHVLGLDHPDQHGQNVVALMNSFISDLDQITEDDIAGARSIYRLKLTSSLHPPSGRSGDNFAYQITANNNPTTYSATGLPPGLQIDAANGLISGSCPTSGTFSVDVIAAGPSGNATGRVQIVILPLPLTSGFFNSIQIGDSFSYQILSGNNPTSYQATGLPAGLQLDTVTGLISGVPQVAGSFAIRVIARSAISEAAGNITLVVRPPQITSPSNPPPVESGAPIFYQITATNNPTAFTVSGLPAGVQFDPATGVISGTPLNEGSFVVTVTAQTAFGNATAVIFFFVHAPRITSPSAPAAVDIGSSFTYQITATGQPTSFSATGLPAGLQIDPASGIISGVPTLSGLHTITVTAHGSRGNLSMQVYIFVTRLYTGDTPAARLPVPSIQALAADPYRPRVYAATENAVLVIDTESLSVIKTIAVPYAPADISLSVDGSKLWVATRGTTILGRIDLESLAVLASLPIAEPADRVREGLGQRLYMSTQSGGVAQIDGVSGAFQSSFNPQTQGFPSRCTIEISPDRSVLFVGNLTPIDPILARYDISTGTAMLAQSVPAPEGTGLHSLSMSHSGQLVSYGGGQTMRVRSAADLNVVLKSFTSPGSHLGPLAFAADDTLIFQSMRSQTGGTQNKIAVLDTNTWQEVRTLTPPEIGGGTARLVVDRTNSHLFTYTFSGSFFVAPPDLLVFPVHPTVSSITPAPKSLLNVSTRLRSQGGENVLIGGFIITGADPKKLALRAIGPSLPLTGKLADPVLELYDGTPTLIGHNDNWNARRADVLATGIPPGDEREAVIPATLQPGSYTVVVQGLNSLSGVALVEAYDLTSDSNSKLANISTRGKVESGDNVMIGGFIIGGNEETTVGVRAIGPSLLQRGVAGALHDPMLAVHDGNGTLLAQNDEWQMSQEQQLIDSGLALSDGRESAVLLSLPPGAYTAIVRGKDNQTGVALVEVYNLDAN